MKKKNKWLGLFIAICACLLLSACAGKSGREVKTGIVFEPDAKEAAPALSPEEVTALKSTGEIDRNLPSTAMADVTKQYCFYLRQARATINNSVQRGQKYLPYARHVFKSKGLPQDLAYLAIVESAYNPQAKSRAGAAGAWQFMKVTGESFGLDQDSWTDDRYDIYEATEAAATYLKKLHQEFRDWPTAVAAYNAGQGKIRRAMEASGGQNFFEVRERNETLPEKLQLKEETKQYVPRFLAVVKIMRNLKALGFPPLSDEQYLQVARVAAKPGTDLKNLSKKLSINWGDFCLLNTHHKNSVVSSAVRDTYVYVPEDKAEEAKAILASQHQGEYQGWSAQTVGSGQTWRNLEKRYHVSAEKIKAANPSCSLKTGELIYLPDNAASVAIAKFGSSPSAKGSKNHPAQGAMLRHTLAQGETLYAVARKYAVEPSELMRQNGISDPGSLPVGLVLKIPTPEKTLASRKPNLQKRSPQNRESKGVGSSQGSLGKKKLEVYVVQPNDTFWKIAQRKHVSVEDLKRWNNLDEHGLKAGAVITYFAEQ
ncbi:MAG: LysM peptidoglycan-binding domain-containing protein [Desulfovibrio sp.]|nr:LysM peptidoglycan-binding domain-containing protein [Desulfovibrio sp.]